MISAASIRRWCWIHKWTSLVCTIFLLMLCVTGLPLIFHEEIDHAFSKFEKPADLPADTPWANLDRIVEAAKAAAPGQVVHLVYSEDKEPDHLYVSLGDSPAAPLDKDTGVIVDSRTTHVLGKQKYGEGGVMDVFLKLHVEMFAGLPGKLFLGVMGGLFVIATISGVVLYAPFMRERSYGVVRRDRSTRLKWLDLHNLLGVSVALWIGVVGFTGVLNTWADLLLKVWQFNELGAMTASYKGQPPVTHLASLEQAVATARQHEPNMQFAFVAYPGTAFSSPHHYTIFMRGDKPFTARLVKPVLIDAQTGAFTDKRDMPWYIVALLVSQPLHFGDYGGLPLKILWALFDVVAIVVLCSGIYLWWKRRNLAPEIDLVVTDAGSTPNAVGLEGRLS
ncbi:MAG TPA: PepSY-associated TM helix domain-containing protein [Opitutaceae bacterium]|nr:PepSY-associated TM helix domain-containing protein [Opitutaceae bacterium]